jgi:NAD(P)-dependent dehydrogenase (short-subunit alcohol dehydrogenase family)
LAGKTAVITGASKGIGLAVAQAFLKEGAQVAICARDRESLDEALKILAPLGHVFAMPADATDQNAIAAFAQAANKHFGSIHCWVNNVGASIPRAGDEYTPDEIASTVAVCFNSAIYGCQTAFRYMKQKGGAIVNVSSLAARCATAGRSTLYGPLKAAVQQLSVMFAAEYAACHIRINSVLPGFTLTPAVARSISGDELEQRVAGTLLQRPAEPKEIADPIVFLCSGRASYITAASLEISGGSSVVLNPKYSYERHKKGQ